MKKICDLYAFSSLQVVDMSNSDTEDSGWNKLYPIKYYVFE